jgi:hypothetical protein
MLIGLCSAKGSPGVTVSALALTLTWPRPVVLAECDPAGGDLAAGFLREVRLDGRGLARLGASLRRGRLAGDFWGQLVDLAPGKGTAMSRLVLPGLAEPGQARAWSDVDAPGGSTGWRRLARLLADLGQPGLPAGAGYADPGQAIDALDVIADCGRLAAPHAPTEILANADVVVLVARPMLPSVRAAAVGLAELTASAAGLVGLLMIGDGEYPPSECARQLGVPLIAALPTDPTTAQVLSNGGQAHRGRLLRAATHAASALARPPRPPATSAGHDRGERPSADLPPVDEAGTGPLPKRLRRRGETSDVR